MADVVKQPLLELLAFGAGGVKRADCHAVVVRMRETGYPVAIVSVAGELVEVLTPDNPEFVKSLRMLESVAQVELKRPTQVRVED